MIQVQLPDGSKRAFDRPVSVMEVAASIGSGLAKAALAGKVDGKLVDTSFVIDKDSDLAIITDKDADGVEVIRHSTAHLLAYAVKELFPDAQVTIGPVIENGFFYEFSYKRPFDQPVSVMEVAASIGSGLAKAALAGKVDGKLVDTSFVIDKDSDLAIITDKDADGVEVIRHSTAHLLAYVSG